MNGPSHILNNLFSEWASVQLPACPLCNLSTLCRLPVSRRCSKQTAKEPRPAGIPVLLGGAGASTPQRQEALPYLCDWECGAGGWEKHENCNCEEKRCMPESQQDEEEKRRKSADEPDPEKGHRKLPPLAPSHSPTTAAAKPAARSRQLQPH